MNDRIPSSPPIINPILSGEKRPLFSVMIPVYNCTKFLPEALNSVLLQDLGENIMQIEVIDDASTDMCVEELVKELGNGRVKYYCQPQNVGSLRNFETCINRAKGELIHILHGDDRVKIGFYKKMKHLFEIYPEAGAAFCNYGLINQDGDLLRICDPEEMNDGILKNWLIRIASWQKIQYVSIVVKRFVYEELGSFYGMKYGEDWEMWVRIAKYFPVAYTPDTLAEYRKYRGSISMPIHDDGQNSVDFYNAIMIIENQLPVDTRQVMRLIKNDSALFCMSKANILLDINRNIEKAKFQVHLAIDLSTSIKIYYHVLKFYIKLSFLRITSLFKKIKLLLLGSN